jgi:hypothetical protein
MRAAEWSIRASVGFPFLNNRRSLAVYVVGLGDSGTRAKSPKSRVRGPDHLGRVAFKEIQGRRQ